MAERRLPETNEIELENISAKAAIRIRRPPSDVFNAFADAGAMSKFWFTRHDDGLEAGRAVTWFLGSGEDAFSFDVYVKELRHPDKLVIEWENGEGRTDVTWSFAETADGDTILTIEETGYAGSHEEIVERALDSTGGFNQVIMAAKALVEHGIALNVVADHAQARAGD